MGAYFCPLCKQEVSKTLYEKITGVWQEKEKKLAVLKNKEKQLKEREKNMKVKFDQEKKKLIAKEQKKYKKEIISQKKEFKELINKEKKAIKEKKEEIKSNFEKKLKKETNKILKEANSKQKAREKELKKTIEKSLQADLNKKKKKLEKDKVRLEKKEKIQLDKNRKLNQQFISFQNKSKKELEKQDKKIKSLKEQLQKNKTPQVLGLLEEKVFLDKLKKEFPKDRFLHTGKKGDITHFVMQDGKKVGTIVYELKKVAHFSKKHIDQTLKAKQDRSAEFGILVTNAKRSKDDFGFSLTNKIIVIHPAGAIVLISILRKHLIAVSKLKLGKKKRDKTIAAVMEYIQSPSFKNGIEGIIIDTKELYENLNKEAKMHVKTWQYRLGKYKDVYSKAYNIDKNIVQLVVDKKKRKSLPGKTEIAPIYLPSEIE
jgi:hypothetical protein